MRKHHSSPLACVPVLSAARRDRGKRKLHLSMGPGYKRTGTSQQRHSWETGKKKRDSHRVTTRDSASRSSIPMLQCHPLYPPGSTLPWKAELRWHWRISSSRIFLEGTKQVLISTRNKADGRRFQWRTLFLSCPSTATGKEGTSERKAAYRETSLHSYGCVYPTLPKFSLTEATKIPKGLTPLLSLRTQKSEELQQKPGRLLKSGNQFASFFSCQHPAKPIDRHCRTFSLMWLFAQEETTL